MTFVLIVCEVKVIVELVVSRHHCRSIEVTSHNDICVALVTLSILRLRFHHADYKRCTTMWLSLSFHLLFWCFLYFFCVAGTSKLSKFCSLSGCVLPIFRVAVVQAYRRTIHPNLSQNSSLCLAIDGAIMLHLLTVVISHVSKKKSKGNHTQNGTPS